MNIVGLDSKPRFFNDSTRFTPTSRWGQNFEDIYRKTNKNLNTGVYVPGYENYGREQQNLSSLKRLEEAMYIQNQQPSMAAQVAARQLQNTFYTNNQMGRAGSSNGFINSNMTSIQAQPMIKNINNQKGYYGKPSEYGGTIDYTAADEGVDLGTIGEDLEAHYVEANRLASRAQSQNVRNMAGSRLHKTIEDNVNLNRLLNVNSKKESQEMEERMRIFEDEIIKRIKIIQNFVKNLDSKVSKIRNSSRRGLGGTDQPQVLPERLQNIKGGLTQEQVQEIIKWDIEVIEKKTEDRFKHFESQIKQTNKKIEENSNVIMDQTANEFQNLQSQFEAFGNNLYERVSAEFTATFTTLLQQNSNEIKFQIRDDTNTLLAEQLREFEKQQLTLESQISDVRISQEQAFDELNKYQDNLEQIIEKNQSSLEQRLSHLQQELDKFKDQNKKDRKNDELLLSQYVKDSEMQEQLEYLRQLVNQRVNDSNIHAGNVDSETIYALEQKLTRKIEEVDLKYGSQIDTARKRDLDILETDFKDKLKDVQSDLHNNQNLIFENKKQLKNEIQQLQDYINDKFRELDDKIITMNKISQQVGDNDYNMVEPIKKEFDVLNPVSASRAPIVDTHLVVKHKHLTGTTMLAQMSDPPYLDDRKVQPMNQVQDIKGISKVIDSEEESDEDFMKPVKKVEPKADPMRKPIQELQSKPKKNASIWGDDIEDVEDIQILGDDDINPLEIIKNPQSRIETTTKPMFIEPPKKEAPVDQQEKKQSVFNYEAFDDEQDDIFADEEWDGDYTAAENVESLIEKFIDHQVEKLVEEYEKQNKNNNKQQQRQANKYSFF